MREPITQDSRRSTGPSLGRCTTLYLDIVLGTAIDGVSGLDNSVENTINVAAIDSSPWVQQRDWCESPHNCTIELHARQNVLAKRLSTNAIRCWRASSSTQSRRVSTSPKIQTGPQDAGRSVVVSHPKKRPQDPSW